MSFLTPVWSYVDALVHPSARIDALTAARHRAFIAPRLVGSFVALASFPVYIVFRGVPNALELGVFGWLMVPILIAYFLSRTGRYEQAQIMSSLSLVGLVSVVAWVTGGVDSFAAVWLLVVPLEAALSASRRAVTLAGIFTLCAVAALTALEAFGVQPSTVLMAGEHGALAVLGLVSAALYATALALAVAQLSRAGEGLRSAEEERYRLLARNMTDVIMRHGKNGAVLFASPAAESLFGVSANELAGHGLFDRVHVADRPAYLTALADSARGEDRSVEFRIRRSGGNELFGGHFLWVEMRCRPLGSAVDGESDVVAVLRDVSERKLQERAVEIARKESERVSDAKGRFLATMSHELRTPLNAIIGFSDMLSNDGIELDRAREQEYAKLINESGRHLLSVVNGILDMSKMESGNFEITPEPFAPGPAIRSCCDILALKAQDSGVELTMRLPGDLPEIVADRRAVNQIVINLLSNAIKFTPRGGRIGVSAVSDGGRLVVAVEDTGVGIGETDLPRLGEAFFQARAAYDRRHDGTGLGLSIVKGLVRLHGGDLDIKSRLGVGTRVTVRLPIDCEERRKPAQPIKFMTERQVSGPSDNQVKKSA